MTTNQDTDSLASTQQQTNINTQMVTGANTYNSTEEASKSTEQDQYNVNVDIIEADIDMRKPSMFNI